MSFKTKIFLRYLAIGIIQLFISYWTLTEHLTEEQYLNPLSVIGILIIIFLNITYLYIFGLINHFVENYNYMSILFIVSNYIFFIGWLLFLTSIQSGFLGNSEMIYGVISFKNVSVIMLLSQFFYLIASLNIIYRITVFLYSKDYTTYQFLETLILSGLPIFGFFYIITRVDDKVEELRDK